MNTMHSLNKKLAALLVCPVCQGPLIQINHELMCKFDGIGFPIRDGVPVMLEQEARMLTLEEKEAL